VATILDRAEMEEPMLAMSSGAEPPVPEAGTVDRMRWGDAESAAHVVLLVHGWGLHPKYYAPLADEIVRRKGFVLGIQLPSPLTVDRESLSFGYSMVADAIDGLIAHGVRVALGRPLALVGESLGATYILSRGSRVPRDARLALLSPGLLLRPVHLLSRRALEDTWRLLAHDQMDLAWRLATVSGNENFIAEVERDPTTLTTCDRAYVAAAIDATFRVLTSGARHVASEVRIWQGDGDGLLSPLGAKILLRMLGSTEKSLVTVKGGEHGLVWDLANGEEVRRSVADWLARD
jgi:alpha-beta hydrolase superfamily lysophospholipase